MNRFLSVLAVLGCATAMVPAVAQDSTRTAVIGRLAGDAATNDAVDATLRKGLEELGYVEGRDFRLETRSAGGQVNRLPRLASELVDLRVNVIVVGTEAAARAAKRATSTIPIVAVLPDHDPVASGLVEGFSHPGGNVTGLTVRNTQLTAKRLEILKEMLPGLARVAVIRDRWVRPEVYQLQQAARPLGVELQLIDIQEP